MKEFNEIETNIDYEDPRMIVSISVDRGDYDAFERACHRNHRKSTELLREFMETYFNTNSIKDLYITYITEKKQ